MAIIVSPNLARLIFVIMARNFIIKPGKKKKSNSKREI
jgi:hypothetical protein